MGECAYYLKAEFPTAKIATKMAEKLDTFFSEAREAYNFYQDSIRHEVIEGKAVPIKKKPNFLETLETKYPLVADYAKTLPGYRKDKPHTVLSGKLDFGQDENNETLVQGNVVCWGDASVWHMADWSFLCSYIQTHFNAVKVVYGTEEDGVGSLDSLQLYDWETIVKDILKHKELHPMLLGVNDDLNKILDLKMRQK